MSWILVIILLSLFSYLAYRRPLNGAVIIIATLPIYLWRFSLFGLPTTFLELMILFLFVIWLIKDKKYLAVNFSLRKNTDDKIPATWRYLLLLWLLVSLLALVVNFNFSSLGLWRAYFLEPIMFFLVLIYEIKDSRDFKLLIWAPSLLLIYLWFVAMWQYFSGWNLPAAYDWPNVKRLTAIFSYPNALGLLIAPLAAFFLGQWLQAKDKLKQINLLILFLLGVSLSYLAKSEGAIFAIGIALLFWLMLNKKVKKLGRTLVIVLLLVYILSGQAAIVFNSIKQQIFDPQLDLTATSLEIRSSQWHESISFLQNNFLFGAGLNGYQGAVRPYHKVDWIEIYLFPHNIFLNFWMELGLIGMVVFIIIFSQIIKILVKLYREDSQWAWPLIMFWISWFVHGLVDVPYFKNDLSLLFFIFLALTIWQDKNQQISA